MKVSQDHPKTKDDEAVKKPRSNALTVDVAPTAPDVDSRWIEYRIEGKNLGVRSYHTSCVHDGKLYVYGGYDVDHGILQDFAILDLKGKDKGFSWVVQSPNKLNYPEQLRSHTAVIHNHCMFIFGGQRDLDKNNNWTF